MRYEDDINTAALDMKSICLAALLKLNDIAPDSGLLDTSSSHRGAAIFAHHTYIVTIRVSSKF